jgi:hypothetical protein
MTTAILLLEKLPRHYACNAGSDAVTRNRYLVLPRSTAAGMIASDARACGTPTLPVDALGSCEQCVARSTVRWHLQARMMRSQDERYEPR